MTGNCRAQAEADGPGNSSPFLLVSGRIAQILDCTLAAARVQKVSSARVTVKQHESMKADHSIGGRSVRILQINATTVGQFRSDFAGQVERRSALGRFSSQCIRSTGHPPASCFTSPI